MVAASPLATARLSVPDRYGIRSDGEGSYLHCLEAPEVRVRVERGFVVPATGLRKAPEGTIYLDGAAQGEPLLDLERRVFNLDHHEGCVRAFTLATCEQALVLALRGWDLKERPWLVLANEPDLDTLLAIWVLLNAHHVATDPLVKRAVIPLLRLEGTIDAHGLEMRELVGFEAKHLDRVSARLQELHAPELELRRTGEWGSVDFLAYTLEQLGRVDRQVYPPGYFQELAEVEELARVDISANRIAVVCASEKGIYELEGDLKKLYGKRLGVIALLKDSATYTLRRVDPFLATGLEMAYERLNRLDPRVREGEPGNRWGGSAEIGGSPRGTGTGLAPADVAWTLGRSFQRLSWTAHAYSQLLATLVATLGLAVPLGAILGLHLGWPSSWSPETLVPFAAGLGVSSVLLLSILGGRRRGLFGLRQPGGQDWLWTLPLGVLGGLLGGSWCFWPVLVGSGEGGAAPLAQLVSLLAIPIAVELLFRGAVHGLSSRDANVQHAGERWFLSLGVAMSTLLYTGATIGFGLPGLSLLAPRQQAVGQAVGAIVLGIAAGSARERSGSVLMAVLVHLAAAAAVLCAVMLR